MEKTYSGTEQNMSEKQGKGQIMFNRLIFSNRLQPTIGKTPINPNNNDCKD
jgi:hypothetical protein